MSSKTKITGMKNLTKPQNLAIFVCVEPLFGCYLNLKLFGRKKLLMHEKDRNTSKLQKGLIDK